MRNVLTIPMEQTNTLIVAIDNSGAIGMKKDDLVHVPYETLAYYSFRVAAMECIAAGGEPTIVMLTNFCGDEAWEELTGGVKKGLEELQLNDMVISGSTESNFKLQQSAVGIMVLGKKSGQSEKEINYQESLKIAVIGKPMVGNEVVEQAGQIAPLLLFQKISRLKGVTVWPVGSKGILSEMNHIFKNRKISKDNVITAVDILKSSGPSTCFIVLYEEERETEVKYLAESYFHSVQIAD